MSGLTDGMRHRRSELSRLERDLADARSHGTPERIASLEHDLADLRVRNIDATPTEMLESRVLDPDDCIACGTGLEWIGVRDLRFGGMTGLSKLLLGEVGEIEEEKLRLEVWACPDCRRVELGLPEHQ